MITEEDFKKWVADPDALWQQISMILALHSDLKEITITEDMITHFYKPQSDRKVIMVSLVDGKIRIRLTSRDIAETALSHSMLIQHPKK